MSESETVSPPTITVRGGNPTDDELAAVMAVLQAVTTPVAPDAGKDDRPLAGGWRSHNRMLRRLVLPGREAWRYSVRP